MVPACVCKVSYLKKRYFLLKKAHYSGQNHFTRILYYQTNKSIEIDRALAVLQYNIEYTRVLRIMHFGADCVFSGGNKTDKAFKT